MVVNFIGIQAESQPFNTVPTYAFSIFPHSWKMKDAISRLLTACQISSLWQNCFHRRDSFIVTRATSGEYIGCSKVSHCQPCQDFDTGILWYFLRSLTVKFMVLNLSTVNIWHLITKEEEEIQQYMKTHKHWAMKGSNFYNPLNSASFLQYESDMVQQKMQMSEIIHNIMKIISYGVS